MYESSLLNMIYKFIVYKLLLEYSSFRIPNICYKLSYYNFKIILDVNMVNIEVVEVDDMFFI